MAETVTASSGGTETGTQATFADAFSSEASPASSTPDASSTTQPAAAQPDDAQALPQQDGKDRSQFIPRQRFDEVNTRMTDAEKRLQTLAWADGIDQGEFQQLQQIARHFKGGNAIEGLQSLLGEMRKDPATDAALRSLHAKALAAARGQSAQPQAPDLNPIPVQLENGQTVGLYGAEQVRALVEQAIASVRQEFQPVVQTTAEIQKAREQAELSLAAERFAKTGFEEVSTWAGMDSVDNQKKLGALLDKINIPDNATDERILLEAHRLYHKHIAPTLTQRTEAKLLDNLKQRAAAASSVNPGSTAATAPKTYTSFKDLPPEAWK